MLIGYPNYYGEKHGNIPLVGLGDYALLVERMLIPMPDGPSAFV